MYTPLTEFPLSPSLILDKAHIGQVSVADDTLEAVGVPALTHGPDHSAYDELSCLLKQKPIG